MSHVQSGTTHPRHRLPQVGTRYGTGRIEAFSDGIFSVAATLLVVDLAVPAAD